MASYRDHLHWILPGRTVVGANILPSTLTGAHRDAGNAFAAREAAADNVSGSSVVIDPKMSAEQLREDIDRYQPVSLKPYHLMSARDDTLRAEMV